MSNKITALILNNKLGRLEAQTMDFTTDPNELTQIKGIVGAGKSSVNKAVAIALSGGSEREVPFDMKAYEGLDVEVRIVNDIYMRTTYKDGSLTSIVYMKDKDGKKIKNPTINGKQFTPAALRDYLKTELTFSSDDFISSNPKVQNDWMMKVYKDKLAEKGVIFDKTSSKYKDSVLYRLEQAKHYRDICYNKVTEYNAYAKRLEEEGHSEKNIPDAIDIEAIENKHKEATKTYYNRIAEIEKKIAGITLEVSKANSVIENYNSSLETKKALADAKEQKRIDDINAVIKQEVQQREKIHESVKFLTSVGFIGLEEQFNKLPKLREEVVFVPSKIQKVAKDEHNRFINTGTYSEEVSDAFLKIQMLRNDVMPLIKAKKNLAEPDEKKYKEEIESAKASNRVAVRWATFYEHQAADLKVKEIWTEYKKIFTFLDLGVEGLKMMVIGENGEIRTMYNGAHDPVLFGNKKKQYRAISSYSETQKNILAVLMQIYLLEEKKKKGVEGLRYLCIDVPIDKKTKELLIGIQKKYDIQLLTTSTGDFERSKLGPGEVLIENGYLLGKEVKNES